MKFSSHTTRWIARLMLGLVLFAQGVLAANACDLVRGDISQAFASQEAEAMEMPCHDEAATNANACFVHCTQGDQVNVDQVSPAFVASNVVTLLVDIPAPSTVTPTYFTSRVALNTGPPVSIRFCSFQI
jgi:hypothetical protein